MNPSFGLLGIVILVQLDQVCSHFEGFLGGSDVFRNPNCGGDGVSSPSSCDCARFNAECVRSGCRECKCRRNTRIYRSDVRKCLSDREAKDPWCRYQFVNTTSHIIPTIDLSKPCGGSGKCSKPINAPFDKRKHVCRVSWVNILENGTWREKPVRKFLETFALQSFDYSSKQGYMYSLEWKTSRDYRAVKRLFQVSLKCVDQDSAKESYCLMFRVKGKNVPILLPVSEVGIKTNSPDSEKLTHVFKPTRPVRRRVNTQRTKVVVVHDNFAVILAAIAGALGTALFIIPLALFCRRTARRRPRRPITENSEPHSDSVAEEVDTEPGTSEETLSSYTSLKRNREREEPPSVYQSLIKISDHEPVAAAPDPIYITVLDDDDDKEVTDEPVQIPPPIYQVLEDI